MASTQESSLTETIEPTFRSTTEQLFEHHDNAAELVRIQNELLELLSSPSAQAAIANVTNNCGSMALDAVLTSVVGKLGYANSTDAHHRVVHVVPLRILELDVNKKIDANTNDSWPTTWFFAAVFIDASEALCKALVDRNADPMSRNAFNDCGVVLAARYKRVTALNFLLATYPVDHPLWTSSDSRRFNVVHTAAFDDSTFILTALLEALGRDHAVWTQTTLGNSDNNAIALAARNGHMSTIKFLLSVFDRDSFEWRRRNMRDQTPAEMTQQHNACETLVRRIQVR